MNAGFTTGLIAGHSSSKEIALIKAKVIIIAVAVAAILNISYNIASYMMSNDSTYYFSEQSAVKVEVVD